MTDYTRDWQRYLGVRDDGEFGPKSIAALARTPAPILVKPGADAWPSQSGVTAFYGPAGASACTAGSVALPFAFPLAWDDTQRVTRFSCHAKVSGALTTIFANAARHYGEAEFRRLRLDRFGGCYNYRPMRGGSSLSMHSWGIAVDLDPANNQLSWGRDRATFARDEYLPFWAIVEAAGATSLGRAKNYDWMHFQFASL